MTITNHKSTQNCTQNIQKLPILWVIV